MKSLDDAKCGRRIVDNCSGFLRVLNVIIQIVKTGCLVVGQSVYRNDPSNFIDLGGGILGCRGLFSSFRALQSGLYLNHDVSASTILKNLRIKVKHLHSKFKISGLSEKPCKEQKFSLKLGEAREGGSMIRSIETTVYDYFVSTRGIELNFSANLPCINAGTPSKPVFFPIEMCFVVPLQKNKKELTVYQKSAMMVKSRQKPEDFIKVLDDDVKRFKLEDEPLFQSCGISISNSFVQAEGRILTPPKLVLGNREHIIPKNGWWNIKDKKFMEPTRLENWAIVKFSTCCDVKKMCQELAKISSAKGMDSLFKPMSQHEDAGIIRELLMEFYSSSGQKKPAQIVIFRSGLSTSQFKQMLEVELDQILKACNFLEEKWRPKFTVLVSQRRHHTKFFDAISGANVTPGTIVDSKVCDIECTNFYMCAHAARIGTLRPTHYHVLLNEIGFSLDDLQELINSLSNVFQRSNNAISEVAPVRYARLAAAKISQVIEHDKMPKVHKNLSSSMFFI
ncbi:hypothetical protein OROHE_016227 [Orobanche hederae]